MTLLHGSCCNVMMAENEKIYWIQVALERLSVIAVNEKE